MSESLALLRLLQLSSPALPIGAFAFSQGLEYRIEQGELDTDERLADWWQALLYHGLARTDLPVLKRMMECLGAAPFAHADLDRFEYWNAWLMSCRETEELLAEERHGGLALRRLLRSLDIPLCGILPEQAPTLAAGWALAAAGWGISIRDCQLAYAWSWLENQVAAAGKSLPLPQTRAQRLLLQLADTIDRAVTLATGLDDSALGQSLPGWTFASVRHECQYSRLFRS